MLGPISDGDGARVPHFDKHLPLARGDETILDMFPPELFPQNVCLRKSNGVMIGEHIVSI